MKLDIATELCKRFEGLHRVGKDGLIYPYICPAGVPTQGYGTVYRPDGRKAMTTNDWGKFNAIVDFAYNLGVGRLQTSTLRRKINAQDWEGAKEQLKLWVRGGGRVLPGLISRRNAEIAVMGAS